MPPPVAARSFALFDVDTRRLHPETGTLTPMPRTKPIAPQLASLFGWAERDGIPEVFTTCLTTPQAADAFGASGSFGLVPCDATAERVRTACTRRQIALGRPCHACRAMNVEQRCFDVFYANPAATELVERLGATDWVVFGSSFDYCLRATAEGLCRLGRRVVVLEDAVLPSPKSTPETLAQTRTILTDAGVSWMPTAGWLARVGAEACARCV